MVILQFLLFFLPLMQRKLGSIKDFNEVNTWEMFDNTLAFDLRLMLSDLYDDIEEFLHSIVAFEKLKEFIQSDTDNIRSPATLIRIGVAHGSLTPNTFKVTSKSRQRSLKQLSIILLDETERLFSNWVDGLIVD
jgi:hypothetical protein